MPELEIALPDRGQEELARLLEMRRSTRRFAPRPMSPGELAGVVWAADGQTADGRRVCPSAHALYPLSVTVVAGNVTGLASGIYRYEPSRHRLRMCAAGDCRDAVASASLADYAWLRQAAVILVLGGDMDAAAAHFAEQPPQGKRGYRYVWLEAGCAAQNVCLWAAEQDLGAVLIGGFDDEALCALAPSVLPRRHHPLALLGLGLRTSGDPSVRR